MNSDPQVPPKQEGFWKRQFSGDPTRTQRVFDVLMGIVAPILCLYFDPIIFRDTLGLCSPSEVKTPSLTMHFAFFAYTLVGLGILILLIWLIVGPRLGRSATFAAGIFFAGAESALALGIMILPISLIGLLLACMGVFGLTPFFTAFVYLRNGARAWQSARQDISSGRRFWLVTMALASVVVVFGIAALVQWQVTILFPETVPQVEICPPDP